MRLGWRAEDILLGRAVVGELGECPLRLALLPQLTILDLRVERVLLDVDGLVLALHGIIEEEQLAVGDAEGAERLRIL